MNRPLISVVIPVYNQENYIQETLESVLNQEGADFEVVAVNDGSTDRSTEMLRKYTDKIVLIEQENMGIDKVRNVGIQRAKGDLIALLDADDCFLPGHLANAAGFADKNPQAIAFYGDARVIDSEGNNLWVQKTAQKATLENLLLGNFIIHSSLIIRRRLFDSGEWYRPFGPAADWDLWIRALGHGELMHYPWIGVEYRKHLKSAIHTRQTLSEEMTFKLLNWVFEKHPGLGPTIKKRATAFAYYDSMVRFLSAGDQKQAKARAILCLRNDPFMIRAWLGLVVSLSPNPIMSAGIRFRRKIKKWLA